MPSATSPNNPGEGRFSRRAHPRQLVLCPRLLSILYLLRYGREMELRRFVVPHASRREHWNKFTGEVQAFGDLILEKTIEGQEEVFWFLTVVQDAIVLWDALEIEHTLRGRSQLTSEVDLKRILPSMTHHISVVGEIDLNLQRKLPFQLRTVKG